MSAFLTKLPSPRPGTASGFVTGVPTLVMHGICPAVGTQYYLLNECMNEIMTKGEALGLWVEDILFIPFQKGFLC